MVAGGGGGDAVTKVGGWEESGYLLIMCLFVDDMFVCWMFVDTMFVLNICWKTSYNWSLFGLANIEITTKQRLDHSYG